MWKPHKKVTDLFQLSFFSQTSTHLVCSVKLFETSSSLSFPKLSKRSSKHGVTQTKLEPKLVLFKANTVAVYSFQKQTKQRNTRSALLTLLSRRSTPTRPTFHEQVSRDSTVPLPGTSDRSEPCLTTCLLCFWHLRFWSPLLQPGSPFLRKSTPWWRFWSCQHWTLLFLLLQVSRLPRVPWHWEN